LQQCPEFGQQNGALRELDNPGRLSARCVCPAFYGWI
jgi:hypothetical protein